MSSEHNYPTTPIPCSCNEQHSSDEESKSEFDACGCRCIKCVGEPILQSISQRADNTHTKEQFEAPAMSRNMVDSDISAIEQAREAHRAYQFGSNTETDESTIEVDIRVRSEEDESPVELNRNEPIEAVESSIEVEVNVPSDNFALNLIDGSNVPPQNDNKNDEMDDHSEQESLEQPGRNRSLRDLGERLPPQPHYLEDGLSYLLSNPIGASNQENMEIESDSDGDGADESHQDT